MASCLLASGTAALAEDVTDPGVIVAEPSPQDPQPDPAPVDPAPVDPGPLPVPDPAPLPVEPDPAPVVPAPVPVVPVPVVPAPAPLPAAPAPVQVPVPPRPVPAPVVAVPLRPQVPGSAATQIPAPQATPLSQAIDSLAALADQSAVDVLGNGAVPGVASATSSSRPSSKATATSALASKEPVSSSQGLPALAQTQIKAAVAVAAGSPFIVQLMTVLALVAAGVAYFRVMGAKGVRTPGQSRK